MKENKRLTFSGLFCFWKSGYILYIRYSTFVYFFISKKSVEITGS